MVKLHDTDTSLRLMMEYIKAKRVMSNMESVQDQECKYTTYEIKFSEVIMPSKISLKPCPFCGGTAAIFRECSNASTVSWQFKVYCKHCQVRQPLHKTKCGAVAEWNHRAKIAEDSQKAYNK
jgi:Lar family restriction alleviation protein